jgi:hypothetical protein
MSAASCPSAIKEQGHTSLVLDSSETALTAVRCRNPSAAALACERGSSPLDLALKE